MFSLRIKSYVTTIASEPIVTSHHKFADVTTDDIAKGGRLICVPPKPGTYIWDVEADVSQWLWNQSGTSIAPVQALWRLWYIPLLVLNVIMIIIIAVVEFTNSTTITVFYFLLSDLFYIQILFSIFLQYESIENMAKTEYHVAMTTRKYAIIWYQRWQRLTLRFSIATPHNNKLPTAKLR